MLGLSRTSLVDKKTRARYCFTVVIVTASDKIEYNTIRIEQTRWIRKRNTPTTIDLVEVLALETDRVWKILEYGR